MKNILTILLVHLVLFAYAQEQEMDLRYGVRGNYRQSILKEKLNAAKTLSDINTGYPSSWIREYAVVELTATNNGVTKVAKSTNEQLTKEQLKMIQKADLGTDIDVNVEYFLQNSLPSSTPRLISFSYTVIPAIEAQYPKGDESLKQYLKVTAIDKIPQNLKKELESKDAVVRFLVDENGKIIDVVLFKPSGIEKIDQLLLDTINNMSTWTPAKNWKGKKVKQAFQFSVGTMFGC